tara:strand:- start:2754 stop:3128 length:375 start_codon:yes stop_codon:yes gene_type:complete
MNNLDYSDLVKKLHDIETRDPVSKSKGKVAENLEEALKPTARISKDTFLGFLYQDNDDIEALGESIYKQLIAKGNATISVNSLWEGTGFIHADIIQNLPDIPAELIDDDEEITDPASVLNVEWT